MKFYITANVEIRKDGEYGDEFQLYAGTDLKEAQDTKHRAEVNWSKATKRDQERSKILLMVYEIPDDTDLNDKDAVYNALCECVGYDLI